MRTWNRKWGAVLAGSGAVLLGAMGLGGLREPQRQGPVPLRLRALVTSPGQSTAARLSPDGRLLAFLSDRDGEPRLWLTSTAPAEALAEAPRSVPLPPGRPEGVAWSPDGRSLAVLLEHGGQSLLAVVPEGFGPGAEPTPLRLRRPRLVRWLPDGIGLESEGALWRFDRRSGSVQQAARPLGLAEAHAFDQRPDGRGLIFVASAGGQADLWSARPDGSDPVRLTRDPAVEVAPRWSGSGGGSLVYASDRGGPLNLWRLDLASGSSRPLTFSGTAEVPEDVGLDGRLVVFRRSEEETHLCALDPRTGRGTELPLHGPRPGLDPTAGPGLDPRLAAPFDPGSWTLYVTRLERASHNLYAYSPDQRTWRRLTDHRFPGTTIAGLEVGPRGWLFFARQRRNQTLWLIEAG
jgi:dipeptidyl aminopeptidase/acylaminoacyl peptidase